MVEVFGGVEAKERTNWWVSMWQMKEGSLVLRRGDLLAEGRRRARSRFVRGKLWLMRGESLVLRRGGLLAEGRRRAGSRFVRGKL
ncbi:hypothetical protein NC653_007122 [Populus alba x Populus x berolinensis]|uniref:Uncharacterized protein n=1 Tax=Populus alba x Populus x berolinensis TaxID=444605 RepID=A0AAD6WFA4_9ROSI|nr:hypothetical protein NC653_007122 [Populus alba x Populus x berolinensis]